MTSTISPPDLQSPAPDPWEPDAVPKMLRPFVDFVARIDARLETKLLGAFLGISILMLALGIVGLFVVNRMENQVDKLVTLQLQSQNADDMLYSITSQSHFRTMALLTGDPVWTEKIDTAKAQFSALIVTTEDIAVGEHGNLFDDLRAIDGRYAAAGERVAALEQAGDVEGALDAHVQSEHEISHEIEDLLNKFIADTELLIANEVGDFAGRRTFITIALATFSFMSLAGALALGAIISWTVIRPVRRIDHALDTLANGDFTSRIHVPNRDEFGKLSENVNRTSQQLADLYKKLESVNQELQTKVEDQVAQLERTSQLRRYLSPQVADSIVEGGLTETRREELSIAFIDIRGFTVLSEQSEPEEMATSLNRFLTHMTDIVFEHGGTLDKYIGDAVMVFFNDPVPQPDHAERAVTMALNMQKELVELRTDLRASAFVEITAGVGISTGFVTVGNFGSPARMDYTVMGNHVNLASRLAGDAGPGEILISERTLALLPTGFVQFEPAGHRNLKGVQRPIALYRVLRQTPEPTPHQPRTETKRDSEP
ncbi:MAG: HAMP domain-containing protein [Acidimicrobiia bacterium]|nr:HAMP domain-containing protein [Acidimicrobiia bacterium]NNL28518.1 HAMP domain-containing protein [Acidimicrobiia bacterium]